VRLAALTKICRRSETVSSSLLATITEIIMKTDMLDFILISILNKKGAMINLAFVYLFWQA
jgi:hypothetical protein